jgi:hypothetical protein
VAAFALFASTAIGQDVTEPSLKAAFIYNFAKFTEWPLDVLPSAAPFVACVLGDDPVGNTLERSIKGRVLSGRSITVSNVSSDGPLRSCHLLYISGVTTTQASQILASVHGMPVLTISDVDDFARLGGIAHVFVENGKMRFDLNFGVAKLSRLQLSSKMLALANRLYDAPDTVKR